MGYCERQRLGRSVAAGGEIGGGGGEKVGRRGKTTSWDHVAVVFGPKDVRAAGDRAMGGVAVGFCAI